MMTANPNSDLRVLMIPVRLIINVYYVTKPYETVPWFPQNYNGIYIQGKLLTAKTNLSRFLNVNVMN
jgi:hypothetical protein